MQTLPSSVRYRGSRWSDRGESSHASLLGGVMAAVIAGLPAQVPSGLQFGELGKRHLPVDLGGTTAVAHGDVDGDGDLDLVIGSQNHRIRLYRNEGPGTFTDATAGRMPALLNSTNSMALGDVDGDGDLDLVIGNGFGQQDRIYLNDGTGTFTDATPTRMPVDAADSTSVALADVDGDGDLDLVIGNALQQSRLYRNNGTGTFADATATSMPIGTFLTIAVTTGDVDGDGDIDLLIGNYGQQNRLYLNSGTGTFTDATASRMPPDSDYTTALALGDVDGDGDLDLVIGNGSWQPDRLYLNDGTGTFTDATANRIPSATDSTSSVALGDVDGDGDLDLVIGGNQHSDRLLLNDGAGTFADATVSRIPEVIHVTTSVVMGDIDGDGDLDLVTGNRGQCMLYTCTGQQNRLYFNNGSGAFSDATAGRMPVAIDVTTSLALGDVDGDGALDLVIGNRNQQNRLCRNNGSGTFTDATASRMPVASESTRATVLGDLDGDGDLDLVIGNYDWFQRNRLYLNDGTGTFTDATASRMPPDSDFTTSLALGDVDDDGDLDLVIGNAFGQQTRLYLNDGTATFADATANRMPADSDSTTSLALGDVDGDGDLDLVIGNGFGDQNRLYRNDGTGSFTDVTGSQMPICTDETSSLALGDLDGDGDLDLMIGNDYSRQNRLYVNNGIGKFTDATSIRMPLDSDETTSLALGDVDFDGDLDLVIGNTNPHNRLYINLQSQLDARHLLRSGQPFTLDVYSRYGPQSQLDIALPYLSTTRQSIPLLPYGILGIDPMASLPMVLIPSLTGMGSVNWTVPNSPALAGIEVFAQAVMLRLPTGVRLGNVTADVILR
jgi:large repetitive protein